MSISRRFGRATAWVVDYPWLAYLVLCAMSSVALIGYLRPQLVQDLFRAPAVTTTTAAPQSSAAAPVATPVAPPNVEAINLNGAHAIVVVQSDDVFTPAGAECLRSMVAAIEELPYVRKVFWMDRVPVLNLFGLREPLLPREDASPARFAAARDKALQHPLVAGQLLSQDGRTVLLMVDFDWLYITDDADCSTRLRETAEAAAARFPTVKFTAGVTGHIPIHLTMMKTHEANHVKYQVIGYSMVLIMAVVLFRGVFAVIIVALAPATGVFWSLGILKFFNLQDNPFNDVVLPVMLSLVGLTDGVHLMVQIRRFRAEGMTERDAARAGLEEVGMACFLTSLTTAIGFWSLSLAQHQVVREFGWSCVLGVTLTFIAVLAVIPLACASPLGRRIPLVNEHGFVERHLYRIRGLIDWVLRYPRSLSALGIGLTIACTLLSLTLRPDERRSSYLPAQAEATRALHTMDQALGGLEFSRVEVHWSEQVAADSPEMLTVVRQVDDLLHQEPLIGTPLSIRGLVDALPGDGPTEQRASMLELLPPELKRAFYKPEERLASVVFRVQDLGIARYGAVFERVQAGLAEIEHAHPQFQLQLTGSAVHRWQDLYQIVVDLASSLGSAALIIFVTLGIAYRSVRLGLIAVIPNVFPLAVTGAWLVFTGQSLEVVSVCSFTICLGIAVDDTIHFLTRYQEESARSQSQAEAIQKAFTGVGASMIMTTLVLVVGFSTVITSDMRDQRIFASMGVLTLIAALVGDLVFLPAMLAVFAKAPATEVASVE